MSVDPPLPTGRAPSSPTAPARIDRSHSAPTSHSLPGAAQAYPLPERPNCALAPRPRSTRPPATPPKRVATCDRHDTARRPTLSPPTLRGYTRPRQLLSQPTQESRHDQPPHAH